eukprot:CAMPEP_0172325280 /NCGR_PEP_ID=MMETSP1058-20130122/53575_1 /TAXON_ID=83371 /ORGANISM="Detonula confervacea, Strain CCMP 353" /LENGTH=658 /DNA_ID=CAMNT_0013041779 /DNA_START=138 /DNA_END=2110 /DNA_ORIENTATION=+
MGGNRRHDRRKAKDTSGNTDSNSCDDSTKDKNAGIIVHLESNTTDDSDSNIEAPPAWSVEFVENIEKKAPKSTISSDDIPSVQEVGLQMVRSTLGRISSKNRKKSNKNKDLPSVKPTPIQLMLWPALLNSFESKACAESSDFLNVVGIAPTGTGKTMSYVVPIVSHCIRTLLCQAHSPQSKHSTKVHGLVLVPTRELAIQVSKEFNVSAKVANKYLSKVNTSSMKVESISVYGGVDIESQKCSLLGKEESSSSQRSLVVAATAGRLLDILKQSDSDEESVALAFDNLQAVVFDEADRIAVNADMAGQVDEILSLLKNARVNKTGSSQDDADIVSCLVSATLPEKAKEMCEKWVPRTRVVIKVDSVKLGEKQSTNGPNTTKTSEDDDCGDTADSAADEQGKKENAALHGVDLSSIPSNIVQTLHVCSNHKKPKKLILTLQRIYMNKNAQSGRFSANNRLTIVFFGQIKTLKNVSKLLVREGLRCVELYGSLHQTEREKRLLEFKAGKRPILLATDVAARGLHVPNVHFVVNYDFPGTLDQYVHRCGRAGRKQALSGEISQYPPTVYSFYPREYVAMSDSVVELLKACNAWVDPNLLALTKSAKSSSKSGRKRKRKNNSTDAEEKPDKDEGAESDNDPFSFLGRGSVLKRASNVSDAEDS